MNSIKKAMVCIGAAGAAMLAAATPVVSNVTMAQSDTDRLVTITYSLSEDAVVTLDVLTNATPNAATGWASIGGAAICNAKGAVWRKVTSADANGQGKYTITWRPDRSWTDAFGKGFVIADGCAKAVVTAWALDNTPDYMVVDVSDAAQPDTQRYYPAADFLPGGASNSLYKTTTLLMRKIMAKDVRWTMGSVSESGRTTRENTHQVTLTNNYYIGVYQVTQTQWAQITGYNTSYFNTDGTMRPVEQVSYNEIRNSASTTAQTGYDWPNNPNPNSFLGLLRSRTGIDFDLPSESQWEFAARASNGEGYWGDGSPIGISSDKDANLDLLGRYLNNPATNSAGLNNSQSLEVNTSAPSNAGTSIVGSYAPNAWGLYDVHGNVNELCLDFYASNIADLNGAVNTSGSIDSIRVKRGGSCGNTAGQCRSAFRDSSQPMYRYSSVGLRVACTAGLK